MHKSFLIAAASSNSGKTTVTMGLLRALRNRGLNVQPYKCGPDYIDTMFHQMASGNESVNLDTFLSSPQHVVQLHAIYSAQSDISIIEGVMGMFDGYSQSRGSSAEIAKVLDIPVILVVNAKSTAYSVAPLIYGFKHFDSDIRLAGVIFNNVASEHHYTFLRQACEDAGVECLGYLPRNEQLVIPGRHLGLTIQAQAEAEALIQLAASEIEANVNLDSLVKPKGEESKESKESKESPSPRTPRIAIARDEAFNFTYRANIDALRQLGQVRFFSPISETQLPSCDVLYLPGGYPELFLDELVSNVEMRRQIRDFAEKGGHIFAECGGFMYLCQEIDGHEMCGVLPLKATMQDARLHLGYRQMEWNGTLVKGHEFHYSSIADESNKENVALKIIRCQTSATGKTVDTPLYRYKNVIAGYTHWYWAETPHACWDRQ